MPALKNRKYELFAQGLAEGKTQEKAYVEAGFSPKGASANAVKLIQRVNCGVQARVQEIIAAREAASQAVAVEVIRQTSVDRIWIVDQAVDLYRRCMQAVPVTDKEGKPVLVETPDGKIAPAYVFDAKGAAAALRIAGLATGSFVMRHQHEKGLLDGLPRDVLQVIRERLSVAVQQPLGLTHIKQATAGPDVATQPRREPVTIDDESYNAGLELARQPGQGNADGTPGGS